MQSIISAANKYTKREGNEMSRNWHSQSSKKLHQARISPDVCQQEQRDHSWLSFDSGSRE